MLELIKHAATLGRNTSYVDTPTARRNTTQGRIQLAFEALPPLNKDMPDAHVDAQIRVFWQRLDIIPLVEVSTEVGVTWLELFTIFYMRGGDAVIRSDAKKHMRVSHESAFRASQSRSKALFRFAADESQPVLKAHLVRHAGNR